MAGFIHTSTKIAKEKRGKNTKCTVMAKYYPTIGYTLMYRCELIERGKNTISTQEKNQARQKKSQDANPPAIPI